MSIEVHCRVATNDDYVDIISIRAAILRAPLGLALTSEDTKDDFQDIQFVAEYDGDIIACLLAKPIEDDVFKLRQMAVEEAYQGQGVGRALIVYALNYLKERLLATKVVLHARATAVPFYEKLHFQIVGDVFEEVGIPHYKMQLHLD